MSDLNLHLDKVKINVKEILQKDNNARADDFYLCGVYLKKYAKTNLNISPDKLDLLIDILMNYKTYRLPNLFTIRRARQQIQKDNPNLKTDIPKGYVSQAELEHRAYYANSKSRFVNPDLYR